MTEVARPAARVARPSPVSPRRCKNCGTGLEGPFCAQCGQKERAGRLTLPQVTAEAVRQFLTLDRGLLRTVRDLFARPSSLVRDVLGGRTQPYVNPVRYFLIWVTVAQLVSLWTGAFEGMAAGWTESSTEPGLPAEALARRIGDFYVLAAAALVPLLALVSRLLFRRRGLTYAEHLVFHLYAAGQTALLWALGLGLDQLPVGGIYWVSAPLLVGSVGWYLWTSAGLFGRTRWGGLVGAIAVSSCALLLHLLGVALLTVVITLLTGG